MCLLAVNITFHASSLLVQGGCVFEKDDTVASLSSIFKWGKGSFGRDGGIVAFVNKYKQVLHLYETVTVGWQSTLC